MLVINTKKAIDDADLGELITLNSDFLYCICNDLMKLGSLASFDFSIIEASTGMQVNAKTSADNIAKTIVNATGVNSFPSNPERVNRGEKTITTINVPDTVGTETSLHAL